MYPASYSAGENKVTISCGKTVKENSTLTYELQKEINGDWTSILEANDTLIYRVNEDTTFDDFSITFFSGTCGSWCFAMFKAIVRSDTCMMDHHTFLKARCGIIEENKTIYSSEISIFSVKGESPKYMHSISNVDERFSKDRSNTLYKMDDVVQLQCVGEVENVNSSPTKDIRWCKKISGKFKVMSLQDRSQTVITSRSKDGCRVVQKSAIFYHVSQNDTLLDIMCESGYPDYGYECGERGINLQIRIPITLIEREEWRMSPIILFDKQSVLNPKRIKLEGAGKLLNLICTASILTRSTYFSKYVNWCIKKEKKAEWTQVSLQESEEKATLISGGKITFYSKIQYHVTVVDSDVHFLCEISNSKTCGTGFTSVQTSVHVDTRKGMQRQMSEEPENNTAVVAALSGLLTLTVILQILVLGVLFRQKEIRMFGWAIRIDRPRKHLSNGQEEKTIACISGNRSLPAIPASETTKTIDCLERACSSYQEGEKRLASTEGDVQQQVNSTYYEGYGYIAVGPIQDD